MPGTSLNSLLVIFRLLLPISFGVALLTSGSVFVGIREAFKDKGEGRDSSGATLLVAGLLVSVKHALRLTGVDGAASSVAGF